MTNITEQDWSFEHICSADPVRAAQLAACGPGEELITNLKETLTSSIDKNKVRLALDSKNNAFVECRSIVQFQTSPEIYDWFFNGRTGYRAHFWNSTQVGAEFNTRVVKELADTLARCLPSMVVVRRIELVPDSESREETDSGEMNIARSTLINSLEPSVSKIWICERLYSQCGRIENIGFATLSAAEQGPKLSVRRWETAANPKTGEIGEGLRAPYPHRESSWLDLKGGFLKPDGTAIQLKPTMERAAQIHAFGWT